MHSPPCTSAALPNVVWMLKSASNPNRWSDPADPPAEPTGDGARPPRRRRRWPWVLLTAVILLATVGMTAPYWLSTALATRFLTSQINDRLTGRVALEDLKLSWRGPTELHNVKVQDVSGREVLTIRRARLDLGLWQLLRSDPAQFGLMTVWEPRAVAQLDPDGSLSLIKALQLRQSSASTTFPDVRGTVEIVDGAVRYESPAQPDLELSDIEVRATFASLNDIALDVVSASMAGGRIGADVSLRDLFAKGRLDWSAAEGQLTLSTDQHFDLQPISELLVPQAKLAGQGELLVDAKMHDGRLQGQVDARAYRLQSRGDHAGGIQPIDIVIAGNMEGDRKAVSGSLTVRGEPGQILGRFEYQPGESAVIQPGELVQAVLTGQPLDWPALTIRSEGKLDLSALAQAVPSLLQIRRDVKVTDGQLEFSEIVLQAGRFPTASGVIRLTQVKAEREGRPIGLEPINASFDLKIEEKQGLDIGRASFQSGFGEAHATGNLRRMKLEIDSDLRQFHTQIGQIWDFGQQELSGALSGDIELSRDDASQIQAKGRIWSRDLVAGSDGRRLALRDAELRFAAKGEERQGRVPTIEVTQASLTADEAITARMNGRYVLGDGAFQTKIQTEPTAWEYLAAKLSDLGISAPESYRGRVELTADVQRASRSEPIASSGQVLARDLRKGERVLLPGDTIVAWNGGTVSPTGVSFHAESVRLESEPVQARVQQLAYEAGRVTGVVDTQAELTGLLRVVASAQGWNEPPAVSGRLSYRGNASSQGRTWSVDGEGQIEQAVFGRGETAVRDPRVTFAIDLRGDTAQKQLHIENTRVDSRLLAVKLRGTIRDYTGPRVLDLTCAYESDWAPIMTLIHDRVPATGEVFVVRGRSSDEFRITGALNDPQARPAYRGVQAEPGVRWDSGELLGIRLGSASLKPRLADARVTLPGSAIPASGGRLNLVGALDLAGAQPVVRVPGRHAILQNVQIDPQMSRSLLSRLNPVFSDFSRIEGTASLDVADVVLPLGEDKSRSAGSGRLTTSQLRVQPKQFFAALLEIGSRLEPRAGGASMYTVRMSDLDFTMDNGSLRYRDFTMYLVDNDLDVKFSGSVTFDGQVDLVASVPVRAGLLERFGVRGPVAEYVRALEGVRVDIPIGGSRLAPKLELASVDIKPLLAKAAQQTLTQEAQKTIGLLLGEPVSPRKPDQAQPPPRKPADRADDLIRGLLGGKEEQRKSERQRR